MGQEQEIATIQKGASSSLFPIFNTLCTQRMFKVSFLTWGAVIAAWLVFSFRPCFHLRRTITGSRVAEEQAWLMNLCGDAYDCVCGHGGEGGYFCV